MKKIKLKIGDEVQIDPNRSTKCEKCGAKVWLAEHKIGIIRVEEIAKGVYYTMSIIIDEEYFEDKIGELKNHIARVEKEPDLFDNAKNEIANTKERIKEAEAEKEELRKKETGEFVAIVHSADFDKDMLTITLPEENLLQVVAIRKDSEAFIVNLK